MKVNVRRMVFALIAVAILGCADEKVSDGGKPAPPARTATTQTSVVQELPSPAGAGAAEPFLSATRDGVALSDDGGVTFAKAVQIDDGKPIGRLDVLLLDEETALVTWLEQTQAGGEIRARRVRAGKVEPAIKIAASSTARAAGFARTARRERDVYFAWTEQSANSKRVHIARGRF